MGYYYCNKHHVFWTDKNGKIHCVECYELNENEYDMEERQVLIKYEEVGYWRLSEEDQITISRLLDWGKKS